LPLPPGKPRFAPFVAELLQHFLASGLSFESLGCHPSSAHQRLLLNSKTCERDDSFEGLRRRPMDPGGGSFRCGCPRPRIFSAGRGVSAEVVSCLEPRSPAVQCCKKPRLMGQQECGQTQRHYISPKFSDLSLSQQMGVRTFHPRRVLFALSNSTPGWAAWISKPLAALRMAKARRLAYHK
jgi:hypothetical protein